MTLPAIDFIEQQRARPVPHTRLWITCWYSGTVSVGFVGKWQHFLPWWDAERMESEFRKYTRGEPKPVWGSQQVAAYLRQQGWPEQRLMAAVEFGEPLATCGFTDEETYLAWLWTQG